MSALLLSLLLWAQGIPIRPMQGGTVTGVLRDSQGKPIAGVRVAAVARGDNVDAVSASAAMAGLAETDEQGRFTLEDIPPGRYAIAAGRLDRQTYYPGTELLTDARILTITAGTSTSDIDFVLSASSFGRAQSFDSLIVLTAQNLQARIPLTIVREDGGPLPDFAYGKPVTVSLASAGGAGFSSPISSGYLAALTPGDYRAIVENLPEEFEIKSITYGNADATKGTFRLEPQNFPTLGNSSPPTTSFLNLLTQNSAVVTSTSNNGTVTVTLTSASPIPAATPPSGLAITIGPSGKGSSAGVRISGSGATSGLIFMSGIPGVTFSDGTYAFRGVPPGRHFIALNGTPTKGVEVVVGKEDLDNVDLREVFILPPDFHVPKDPRPAGSYQPGTILLMPSIRGVVREEKTGTPLSEATIEIRANGRARRISIDADGHFQTMQLLPGIYELRLEAFAHSTRTFTVTVDDQDVDLDLTTLAL